jgi:hypothetical protein
MPLVAAGIAVVLSLVAATGWWSRRRRRSSRAPEPEDRRRSYRVALAASVSVYGWIDDQPFSESTETLDVSAGGGLIPLSVSVTPSQELILTNLQSDEDLTCRVARSTQAPDGKILVGLDFVQVSPNFWQIDFISKVKPRGILTAGLRFSSLAMHSSRKQVTLCRKSVFRRTNSARHPMRSPNQRFAV